MGRLKEDQQKRLTCVLCTCAIHMVPSVCLWFQVCPCLSMHVICACVWRVYIF
uniref:Uncharacterized protein n=1 Tax=Setaria italica TaxID=4555 RepID=K3ZBS7_SETIT